MRPNWAENSLHPIVTTVTRITSPDSDGHATGFYYKHDGSTYLVTNKHAIFDPEEDHEPDSIKIRIRDVDDVSRLNTHSVSIGAGIDEDWFVHPRYPEADVAVVPIHPVLSSLNDDERYSGSLALDENYLPPENVRKLLDPGNQVMIMGYPGVFKDRLADTPVFRNAVLSTFFGYRFDDQPVFITDAKMHQGNSGSPIFFNPDTFDVDEENDQILFGETSYFLIGIHSGTFRWPDAEILSERTYNLNTSWYFEIVADILEHISSKG
jgi:hypothetical protein